MRTKKCLIQLFFMEMKFKKEMELVKLKFAEE